MGQDSPLHTNPRAAPVRVAGGYLLFGLLWIWLSDRAVLALGLDGVEGFWVGATKGTVFVALSAALLYWLVGREVRALTRTMGLLRAIAEGTPDAVFVKDLSGKYLLINHAGAEIIGRPVADIIGADDTALFVPETAERLMAQDRAVVASGAARNTEADLVTPSGPRTFSATKAPYRDASGAVLGVLGISRDVTDHKKAEAERRSHLRFFECMDRINRAVQGADDFDRVMGDVLDVVLVELGCDRAWLAHPCDPAAPAWAVPMERTRPEHPGAMVQGTAFATTPESARVFRAVLAADGPVRFGPGAGHPLPAGAADRFGVRSQLAMALRPLTGRPWMFGLHQCSGERLWAPADERLFREIGLRLTGALTGLLAHRDLRAGQHRYQQLVATVDGIVWEADPRTTAFTFVSDRAERLFGYPVAEWTRDPNFWSAHLHPDDRDGAVSFCLESLRAHRNHDFEYRMIAADGRVVWVRDLVTVVVEGGAVTHLRGVMVDVTAQKRAEAFQAHQNRVLEQIATGAPLGDTLAAIVQLVEDEFPDTVGSVLLLDRDGARLRPGAAPRLPPAYTAAIDGVAIGPRAGSCGTAAHTREPVYVADIGADPLWADFKALALAHGLRACWSTPVLGAPRGPGPRPVLGTFAVYARVPGAPPPRFAEVVARAEHLASVAIESDRADRELRESEERFRAYVDHAADALMLHDASGAVVDVNRQACASLGYARDELIGLTPADFDPDVTPEGLAGIFAGLGAGGTVAFDSRHRRKDGTVFPVDLRIRPFEMGGRRFHLALARDITERKSAEAALHRRLAELTALHRIGVACSQARTADEVLGRVTAVIAERFFPDNCGFLLLDAGRGVLVPHPSFVLTDPAVVRAEIPLDTGVTGRVARTGQPVRVGDVGAEPCYLAADPRTRSELCVPMTIGSKVVGVFNAEHRDPGAFSATDQQLLGTVVDLAGNALERLRAEESLRASEERYRDLVELSPEGVSILYEGTFVYVNRPGAGVLGLTPADLLGRPLAEFLHPDDVPVSRARQGAVVASGCAAPLHPFRLRHADGTWRVLESCAGPCRFEGKAAVQVLARDATERLRAEAALREREEQLRLFVDHVWAAIAMVGTDMRYIRTSRRWLTDYQLGPRDLTGLSFYEVFPETPERWKAVHRRCLAGAEERCEEDRFERADGTVQVLRWEIRPWRRADGAPAGLVIYTEDITARKRLEAHYQQVTKMEAVGRLAGGIAHDFNNLLTVINGFSDMALRGAGAADPHRAALTEIRAAGERAARLTQQLLAYSRKAMIEPKVLDLNELVTESVKMIRLVGEDVLVARALDPGPVRIRADRGQIEQVLMNLVVNARDAMPAGGRLAIETRTVTLGPDELPDDPDLRPGRYVRLTVADTGAGMTEEVRAKVFEPFFTTKEVGKGTGLGLAVAQGAVKQNGGHISVTSAVGAGTTFTLLFPAVPGAPGESGEAPPPPVRGTETLLLVEDEDAVRAVTRLGLEGYGYTVLAAGGGPAALALADRHPGHIDLLVTDVVMPHMGGRELAERLRHRRPGLRALFVSGYTDDVVLRHGLGSTADGFLQKPFTPQTLARKVREMMDQDG